jgi:NAD(P)-dependent dehydrogenase (short-subunit alcohol dehydrogenase family)
MAIPPSIVRLEPVMCPLRAVKPISGSQSNDGVYAMTKAAVAVMVKGIAVDLAPRGITVNNIQPGPTLTDMTADYIDSIVPAIPRKRVGDPDEIAGLVAYLASGESGELGPSLKPRAAARELQRARR